jgi:aldehyde dehydrogenase (NAD+)
MATTTATTATTAPIASGIRSDIRPNIHADVRPDMSAEAAQSLLAAQRAYFATGATQSVEFRREQLQRLKNAIKQYEPQILAALKADLHKAELESYLAEVYFVVDEISFALRHVRSWVRPAGVSPNLLTFPSSTKIHSVPLGVALIISPWNYPFQLLLAPLVAAMSAGNTAVLKPSELAPAMSNVVAAMIRETFAPEYIAVAEGGVPTNTVLLEQHWDYIFFTGGTEIGRIVAQAAAKHLTPYTLELGGKSPCFVTRDANLDMAARRIAWGKYLNAGQTCIAPDYVLVDRAVERELTERLQGYTVQFFGNDPQRSPDYGRIINDRHFSRLQGYLADGELAYGGTTDAADRYIAPTALRSVSAESRVMQDEIFGPILPIMPYDTLGEAIAFVNERSRPLALYAFAGSKQHREAIVAQTISGGVALGDTLMQIATPHAPFGGVGSSGSGAYHGKFGFDTFSHRRTVTSRPNILDVAWRYAPYGERFGWMRKLLK